MSGNMSEDLSLEEHVGGFIFAAEQCISRGHHKNYVPCWDKECETLYCSFIRAPLCTDSDRAALSLLSQLEQRKQD